MAKASSSSSSRNGDSDIEYSDIEVVSVVDVMFAPYQRGLSLKWVNELADMFDENKCDPIVLSKRKNGDLYCLEGQHRVKAAMKNKVSELLARVLTGLTYEQEADYFYQAQKNRRGMRPQDAWNASLEARHQNTVEINTIVDSLGGRVNRNPDMDKGINCPGQLWRIHEYAGKEALYDLLKLIDDCWPECKLGGTASEARMLAGFMFFVVNHQDYNRERLVRNFRKVSPLKVRETGQRYRDLGRKADEGFYNAILDIYNKGLRDELRLEPKKCDWRVVRTATKRRLAEKSKTNRAATLARKR